MQRKASRLGIISDTQRTGRLVANAADLFLQQECDAVIHAGDFELILAATESPYFITLMAANTDHIIQMQARADESIRLVVYGHLHHFHACVLTQRGPIMIGAGHDYEKKEAKCCVVVDLGASSTNVGVWFYEPSDQFTQALSIDFNQAAGNERRHIGYEAFSQALKTDWFHPKRGFTWPVNSRAWQYPDFSR